MLTSLFLLLIKAETTPDSTSAASASSHHALGHEAPSKDFRIATKAARLFSQLGVSFPIDARQERLERIQGRRLRGFAWLVH